MFLSLPVESERVSELERESWSVYMCWNLLYILFLFFPLFFFFASSISLWWWLREMEKRDETLFELSWKI